MGEIFTIILFALLCIFVVVLIILGIKLIAILNKADDLLDDVNAKMEKLNGIFNLIDKTSEVIENASDKIARGITRSVSALFRKNKKKEDK